MSICRLTPNPGAVANMSVVESSLSESTPTKNPSTSSLRAPPPSTPSQHHTGSLGPTASPARRTCRVAEMLRLWRRCIHRTFRAPHLGGGGFVLVLCPWQEPACASHGQARVWGRCRLPTNPPLLVAPRHAHRTA